MLASSVAWRLRLPFSTGNASRRQWLRFSRPPQWPNIIPSHGASACPPTSRLLRW